MPKIKYTCNVNSCHTASCTRGERSFYKASHFATKGATADLFFPIIWETIHQIEAIGQRVVFITADGASSNQNAQKA